MGSSRRADPPKAIRRVSASDSAASVADGSADGRCTANPPYAARAAPRRDGAREGPSQRADERPEPLQGRVATHRPGTMRLPGNGIRPDGLNPNSGSVSVPECPMTPPFGPPRTTAGPASGPTSARPRANWSRRWDSERPRSSPWPRPRGSPPAPSTATTPPSRR